MLLTKLPPTPRDDEGTGCALIVVLLAILVACTFAYRSCENTDHEHVFHDHVSHLTQGVRP